MSDKGSRDDLPIGLRLRIKYGLERVPTESEIREWLRVTENLVAEGEPKEKAGEIAARYNLPGYQTRVLKAEADNIEALLKELAKK